MATEHEAKHETKHDPRANTHGPPQPVGPSGCGCSARIDELAERLGGVERVNKTLGYLSLLAAAGVCYLLWTADTKNGDGKK